MKLDVPRSAATFEDVGVALLEATTPISPTDTLAEAAETSPLLTWGVRSFGELNKEGTIIPLAVADADGMVGVVEPSSLLLHSVTATWGGAR